MRSTILGIIGVVALTDAALAQTAEAPPPTREALNFKAPDGFVQYNAAGDNTYYTAEYRLASEKQNAPSRTLAFQAFRDRTVREPIAFNADLATQRVKYCPQATSEILSTDREQDFETAVTMITCEKESAGGRPSTEFVKSVKGETIFLTLHYTLYGAPDAAQKRDVVAYLKTVGLCRRNGGCVPG